MLKFTKMHGLGNDYVYMDCTKVGVPDNVTFLAQFVSNRHFGVGSDGLILICASDTCDFKMRMFNQDGSEAEMCGNGVRCLGKFVYDKGLTSKKEITVETLAGIKTLALQIEQDKVIKVEVDMGEPILEANCIPVVALNTPVTNLTLQVDKREFLFTCVSMGNPHAITVVDNIEDCEVKAYGSQIEIDSHFPMKTNVEFVKIIDKSTIWMRVWERGTGETMACGTGACAAAVACHLNGLTKNEVTVKLLGGDLTIKWNKVDNHVYMTGPAVTVFEGELEDF
ncbi:MAG: diaminopimelate epimerase [Clostridia bacterium]|nr:diaminopimelate epimerase [Clostridia bacterium]